MPRHDGSLSRDPSARSMPAAASQSSGTAPGQGCQDGSRPRSQQLVCSSVRSDQAAAVTRARHRERGETWVLRWHQGTTSPTGRAAMKQRGPCSAWKKPIPNHWPGTKPGSDHAFSPHPLQAPFSSTPIPQILLPVAEGPSLGMLQTRDVLPHAKSDPSCRVLTPSLWAKPP